MAPSIQRIRSTRALVMWLVRVVGSAMVALGVYLLVKQLVFGLMVGHPSRAWQIYQGVGEWHIASHGAAAAVVGLPMVLLSRRIARFVVAMPDRGCPGCAYTGERDGNGKCPECGLELPR
ncbi:MAG: hypothetical protein ACTS3F_13050 [Phycisphaerales bacterium]